MTNILRFPNGRGRDLVVTPCHRCGGNVFHILTHDRNITWGLRCIHCGNTVLVTDEVDEFEIMGEFDGPEVA